MEDNPKTDLKSRILKEMTVDYQNSLDKNFDLVKQFIRITQEGKVDVLIKEKISGQDQILLYLIGKLYAKEAGIASTYDVAKEELMEELGLPEGSVFPWLKALSDNRKIKKNKRDNKVYYAVMINAVEKFLKTIENRLVGAES